MTLPNFLIVGAPRCGTTSLYRYLQSHPEVFLPEVKEPGFFSEGAARKVDHLDDYGKLFAGTTEAAIGEASPTYLFDEAAPGRIFNTLGGATRILVLLRNPVDQAHSLWRHMAGLASEDLSFMEAVAAEPARLSGERSLPRGSLAPTYYAYISRARFAHQVRRYVDTFPADGLRVEIFEEFFADPAAAYTRVCEFLEVGTDHVPDFEVHNPSGAPRSHVIGELLNRRSFWKEPLKAILPLEARLRLLTWGNRLNRRGKPPGEPLNEDDTKTLRRFFEEDVRELEQLLGRSLADVWW